MRCNRSSFRVLCSITCYICTTYVSVSVVAGRPRWITEEVVVDSERCTEDNDAV